MNAREQLLMNAALDRLQPLAADLIADGWRPELIAFAPSEIERLPGYKVALVVPLDSLRLSDSTELVPAPEGFEARCECGTRLAWKLHLFAYEEHAHHA